MNVLDTKIDSGKCLLSALLPYDISIRKSDFRTSLNEYCFLLNYVKAALVAFQNGRYEEFDAYVGDNASLFCAVRIAMMQQGPLNWIESLQFQVANAKKEVKDLISYSNDYFRGKELTVKGMLQPVDITLTSDEMFLVESFLLSEAKSVERAKFSAPLLRNVELDLRKIDDLGALWNTGRKFRKGLVQKALTLLSESSVAFVQVQANYLQDRDLQKMCSKDFTVRINGLSCIPMYWAYKTLLLTAEEKGLPIVIKAQFIAKDRDYSVVAEDCIFLRARSKGGYIKSIPCGNDLAKSAIVIQGAVCDAFDRLPCKNVWRKAIACQKLGIILANAAASRQYPNPGEDVRIKNLKDDEFVSYKFLAKDQGCTLENPSLFFIQNVYSKALGDLPQLVKSWDMLYKFWMLRLILPQEAILQMPYYLEFECDK